MGVSVRVGVGGVLGGRRVWSAGRPTGWVRRAAHARLCTAHQRNTQFCTSGPINGQEAHNAGKIVPFPWASGLFCQWEAPASAPGRCAARLPAPRDLLR